MVVSVYTKFVLDVNYQHFVVLVKFLFTFLSLRLEKEKNIFSQATNLPFYETFG